MARSDPGERMAFFRVRKAELSYGAQLRRLARHVAQLLNAGYVADIPGVDRLVNTLEKYAEVVEPWAENAAERMLREVAFRDTQAWEAHTRTMGRALMQEIREAPTGAILQDLQAQQVRLITSLPLEAAQQVHDKTLAGLSQGMRFESIVDEIRALGSITVNRATLIARTEVGRSASNLTQGRAQFIGSEGYIWRTSEDRDVRPTHKRMDGKYVRWDSPPKTDANLAPYHAGCGPNCRCFAEPVIPDHLT